MCCQGFGLRVYRFRISKYESLPMVMVHSTLDPEDIKFLDLIAHIRVWNSKPALLGLRHAYGRDI